MQKIQKNKHLANFIIFASIFIIVLYSAVASNGKPKKAILDNSPILGQKLPNIRLPELYGGKKIAMRNILAENPNGIFMIHFFASWCSACAYENAILLGLQKEGKLDMPIYAINWMDIDIKAKMWLQKYGNPFKMILQDNKSRLALPLGVTATPESFVVTPTGEIIMHIRGVITPKIMEEVNLIMQSKGLR